MVEFKFNSETMERFIVSYLLRDRAFFVKAGAMLKTSNYERKSYFLDPKLQWLINTSCIYYDAYKRTPSLDTIKIIIEKKYKDDELLLKSLMTMCEEIYTKDLSGIETDFLKNETIDFIKKLKAAEATYLNQMDIESGNYDHIVDRIQKAVNISLDKDMGVSLANTGETLALLQEAEEDSGLTFGSPSLDRQLGSPKKGEITVFCGTPGVGKTIWLGNVATENMKLGKKGVFFSLEVDKRRLARRLYSSLLYKSGCDILSTTKEEADAIFKDFNGGDIRIKNFQAHTACCNDFATYLQDLYTVEGFKPDFICIDYILITAANDSTLSDNMYSYYKIVTEEMRNLAVQFECPVFTAAQINRNGMGDKGGTKGVVTSKDLSESRGILDTADYLLIINQTDTEKKLGEKDNISEQRLYIDKNRNGSNGNVITYTLDYNKMILTEGKKQRTA